MPDYNPQDFSPSYGGQIDSNGNVKNLADAITGSGTDTKLKVDIGSNIELGEVDIQIGAVELKDGTTDKRAAVGDNGLHVDIRGNSPTNPFYMAVVGSIDGGVWP